MLFLADASIGENITSALSSMDLWTAVAKSVIIILIGFLFTKFKIFHQDTGKILTKIVMVICLPCLAFNSFMTTITWAKFNSAIVSFVYGFVVYVLFIFFAKLLFMWEKNKDRRIVLEILFAFGSTTFFGQPLIQAVFPNAYNDSNMFNIAYRVFLYSYAYYAICVNKSEPATEVSVEATEVEGEVQPEKKSFDWKKVGEIMKKIFVNPIIICTLAGFLLWALQLIPAFGQDNWFTVLTNAKDVAAGKDAIYAPVYNIQFSLPWLYQTLKTIGGLASPLVWIAIGCTLGKVPFKEAAADKTVWIYSFMKLIIAPMVNIGLLLLINLIPGITVTFNTVAATTIMWAVPPATVAVSYCISSNREATFASSCSLISTLVAVVFIPVYMVLLTVIQSAGLFA